MSIAYLGISLFGLLHDLYVRVKCELSRVHCHDIIRAEIYPLQCSAKSYFSLVIQCALCTINDKIAIKNSP